MSKKISITDFYKGQPNNIGATLEEIWDYDIDQLETKHNYIQWLFPLKEKSSFNLDAPALASQDIKNFKTSEDFQFKFRMNLFVMLDFFGLEYDATNHRIVIDKKTFPIRAFDSTYGWIINRHNFLRITRIIKSCGILGFKEEGKLFFIAMCNVYRKYGKWIGEETWKFWRNSAKDYLL